MRLRRRILSILFLCGLSMTLRAEQEVAALDSCFFQQKFEELKTRLPQVSDRHRNHPAILLYQAFLHHHADSALALYKKAIAEAPNSIYAEQALFRIGQYYYFRQGYRQARNHFSALYRKFPQSSLRDDAQYLYCLCVLAEGKPDSARAFLNAFVKNVGNSPHVDQAILDLERLGGSPQPTGRAEYYTIQVALLRTHEEALEAVQKLSRVFSHVEVVESEAPQQWPVTVGKFIDRDRAQRYAEMYIKPSMHDYKIIPRRQL